MFAIKIAIRDRMRISVVKKIVTESFKIVSFVIVGNTSIIAKISKEKNR